MLQHAGQPDRHVAADNLGSPNKVSGLGSIHAARVVGRQIRFIGERQPERISLSNTNCYGAAGSKLLERDGILGGHVPNGIGKALSKPD